MIFRMFELEILGKPCFFSLQFKDLGLILDSQEFFVSKKLKLGLESRSSIFFVVRDRTAEASEPWKQLTCAGYSLNTSPNPLLYNAFKLITMVMSSSLTDYSLQASVQVFLVYSSKIPLARFCLCNNYVWTSQRMSDYCDRKRVNPIKDMRKTNSL